jgi:hypothetical protein
MRCWLCPHIETFLYKILALLSKRFYMKNFASVSKRFYIANLFIPNLFLRRLLCFPAQDDLGYF